MKIYFSVSESVARKVQATVTAKQPGSKLLINRFCTLSCSTCVPHSSLNIQIPHGLSVSFTALRLRHVALHSHLNSRGSMSVTSEYNTAHIHRSPKNKKWFPPQALNFNAAFSVAKSCLKKSGST